MTAKTIKNFRIEESIGAGRTGQVYRAKDMKIGREVALKVLNKDAARDPFLLQRFEREAKAAASLSSANILGIYELGQVGNIHFMVSELIHGSTLRQIMVSDGLPLTLALGIAIQVSAGLSIAHGSSVIHRDIKPENIMIRNDGSAVIIDFGASKFGGEKLEDEAPTILKSQPGTLIGTFQYMSPEQIDGMPVNPVTFDLWALGVLIFEMVTGHRPFSGDTFDELRASIRGGNFGPLPETMPSDLKCLVTKLLAGNMADRYQSMDEAHDALKQIAQFETVAESGPTPETVGSTARKSDVAPETLAVFNILRDRWLSTALFLLMSLTLVWGVVYYRESPKPNAQHSASNVSPPEAVRPQPLNRPPRRTPEPEARRLYGLGIEHWNKRVGDNLPRAVRYFTQAVSREPDYVEALSGLAACYVLEEEYLGTPSSESLPKAELFANKALAVDPDSAEANGILGYIRTKQWRWDDAESLFQRSIDKDGSNPTIHQWFSLFLRTQGQNDRALAEIKRAYELQPTSIVINANLAFCYLLNHDPETAIEQCAKLTELDTGIGSTWSGLALLEADREQEALVALEVGAKQSSDSVSILANQGYGNARLQLRDEAKKILARLLDKFKHNLARGQDLAKVYAGLGDLDSAFEYLEIDYQRKSGDLPNIVWHPAYGPLRRDPRYESLIRRMGLKMQADPLVAGDVDHSLDLSSSTSSASVSYSHCRNRKVPGC